MTPHPPGTHPTRFEGTSATSKQAMWLKVGLSASTSTWKLVICHNPPFSSSVHGSSKRMRWPFEAWGATAVLSGHDHSYERVVEGDAGFPYFVNGLGGGSFYSFPKTKTLETGSAMRFAGRPAVQLIEADASRMIFRLLAAPHHHVESGEEGRLRETEEVDCYGGWMRNEIAIQANQQMPSVLTEQPLLLDLPPHSFHTVVWPPWLQRSSKRRQGATPSGCAVAAAWRRAAAARERQASQSLAWLRDKAAARGSPPARGPAACP